MRYFIRGVVPLRGDKASFSEGPFFAFQNELFLNLQHRDHVNGKVFDQNRLFLAGGYRLSSRYDLEVGYMNQFINGRANDTEKATFSSSRCTRDSDGRPRAQSPRTARPPELMRVARFGLTRGATRCFGTRARSSTGSAGADSLRTRDQILANRNGVFRLQVLHERPQRALLPASTSNTESNASCAQSNGEIVRFRKLLRAWKPLTP